MLKSNRIIARTAIADLDLTSRVQLEAVVTDARSQAIDFSQFAQIDTIWTSFAAGRDWRRCVADFFGALEGKTLLDVGCGYSMTPVIFALAGARVHAIDVAPKTIATVQQFAGYMGVADRMLAHVGPAERMPFESDTFDLVFGGAALHHLQLEPAASEIARVLKPGGKGAFQGLCPDRYGRQDTAPSAQFFAAPRFVQVRRILVRPGALHPALCTVFRDLCHQVELWAGRQPERTGFS